MFNVYMLFVVDAKKVHDKKFMKICVKSVT